MTDWRTFPESTVDSSDALFKIHLRGRQPSWFNNDGSWRFDPPPGYRHAYGVCYLGLEPLSCYVEVFGRMRGVPQVEIRRRRLSELGAHAPLRVADLTNRRALGFGVTGSHSTGHEYGPSQELSARLYEAGFAGIRYRVRHDPAMTLEAVAIFGEPGENLARFSAPKTRSIPAELIEYGREAFDIEVLPSANLP